MEFRKVYNDKEPMTIQSTAGVYSMIGFNEVKRRDRRGEREKEKFLPRKKVKDYFKTLAKATETSNQQLDERGIPYRFCVYQEDDKVFIDFITLDTNGDVKETQTKDITNEDFNLWIENIANIAGLNIDKTG